MNIKNNKRRIIAAILCSIFLFIGLLCFFAARWYVDVYGDVGFDSIIYTLFSDLGGVDMNIVTDFMLKALLPAIALTAVLGVVFFLNIKKELIINFKDKFKLKVYPFQKIFSIICSSAISLALIISAATQVDLINYVKYMSQKSTIFEDKYVNPSAATIIFPEEKQNLIFIFLESVETTYYSQELGGGNDFNAIPELYELAKENVNFSHNDSVGGANVLTGGSWTIGAMVSQTSGVPLKMALGIDHNTYGQEEGGFLPGITSISDVLHENGYYQALMVGSDASFGGRKQYFEQHGTDKIYDLFSAREAGIVAPDYHVWWGMEDAYLFQYAKQELTEIAKQDQPFAFTMLTVDTHFANGYVCDYCGTEHAEQYENVLSCSSKQVYDFVKWIQEQDFYENTTIVISGDHLTMDNDYISRNVDPDYERTVYNCFINAKAETDNLKNRDFCTLDMFPTTLAALGCTIEGNRLGLGTNLFSDTKTLCEELGTEQFDSELSKSSEYYSKHFFFE